MKNTFMLFLLVSTMLFGCKTSKDASSNKSEEKLGATSEKWVIASQLAKCNEDSEVLCYQVKKTGSTEYEMMNIEIENFMFEAGHKYQLQIDVIPSKKSDTRYVLVKELFKVASK